MKKLKSIKGITLVALIITIIVLLILAGAVINMTLGNDGIIAKAQGAVDLYKNAKENEEMGLAKIANGIDLTTNSYDVLNNFEITEDNIKELCNEPNGLKLLAKKPELINKIKADENYLTKYAKIILDSTTISEQEKYEAGLPCYLFKKGSGGIISWSRTKNVNNNGYSVTNDSIYMWAEDAGGDPDGIVELSSASDVDMTKYSKISINSYLKNFYPGYNSEVKITIPNGTSQSYFETHNTTLQFNCNGKGKLVFYLCSDTGMNYDYWYVYDIYLY